MISNYGSCYVNQYNSKAEYIRTFGGRGAEAGKLAEPHGIWVDTRAGNPALEGNIFVVEWVEVARVTKLRKVA